MKNSAVNWSVNQVRQTTRTTWHADYACINACNKHYTRWFQQPHA